MTGCWTTRGTAAALALLSSVAGAAAGPLSIQDTSRPDHSMIVAAQYYGYGYPAYGYRHPYGFYRPYGAYRPYGYGPGPRYYSNHFGPGAAKERYVTRRNFCRNKPEQC